VRKVWFGITGAAPGVDCWGIIGDAALIAAIGLLAAIIAGVV
jgi:hypothetical protein